MPAYNSGRRRHDLRAVEALLERAVPQRVPRHVAVVGTNGKSSTARFLAQALRRQGVRTGLYTSPHLRRWTERVQVDLEPVPDADLGSALVRAHAAAQAGAAAHGDVRFFDVLTLAAENLFAEAGVQVAVFEAGIGGRLDAIRCLEPELTLLTSIGRDHEELLGADPLDRLREKAGVAPAHSHVIAGPLPRALAGELARLARERPFELTQLEPAPATGDAAPAYQQANARLAEAGARRLGGGAAAAVGPLEVPGRFQRGVAAGVPYLADVAHNVTAWDALLGEVPPEPHEVVVAITPPRPATELVASLRARRDRVARVTVTGTVVRAAHDPGELAALARAAGFDAEAIDEPTSAFASAAGRARRAGRTLLVFGSNYVVVDFLAWAEGAGSSA